MTDILGPNIITLLTNIGSVGVFALVGWYLWLRMRRASGEDDDSRGRMHIENRDSLVRIERLQDQEIQHLNNLVRAEVRVAEILEALTQRMNEQRSDLREAFAAAERRTEVQLGAVAATIQRDLLGLVQGIETLNRGLTEVYRRLPH